VASSLIAKARSAVVVTVSRPRFDPDEGATLAALLAATLAALLAATLAALLAALLAVTLAVPSFLGTPDFGGIPLLIVIKAIIAFVLAVLPFLVVGLADGDNKTLRLANSSQSFLFLLSPFLVVGIADGDNKNSSTR
jgi:hypothetical protein